MPYTVAMHFPTNHAAFALLFLKDLGAARCSLLAAYATSLLLWILHDYFRFHSNWADRYMIPSRTLKYYHSVDDFVAPNPSPLRNFQPRSGFRSSQPKSRSFPSGITSILPLVIKLPSVETWRWRIFLRMMHHRKFEIRWVATQQLPNRNNRGLINTPRDMQP